MSTAATIALPFQTDKPFLREMLSNPIEFGEVYHKSSFAPTKGVREVLPGPPSPPASLLKLDTPASAPLTPRKSSIAPKLSPNRTNEAGPSNGVGTAGFIGPHKPQTKEDGVITPRKSKGGENGDHTTPTRPTPVSPAGPPKKYLYPKITDLAWPNALRSRNAPAAGLFNPSMTCYANATLQVILHTPPFLRIARQHDPETCLFGRKRLFCMLCSIREMAISSHWTKSRYAPREIHNNLSLIKKGFNRNRQEDAHEFFRFVTDAFQNSALAGMPKTIPHSLKHTSWVHRLWGGQMRSRVTCSRCLKPSDTFDYFLDLSLDCHASRKGLVQMLQAFVKEDKLEGDNKYHCETCKAKSVATKSFRIAESPPILTFHLKRFSVNYSTWNGKAKANKYNQHVDFPELLDISPYMIDHSMPGCHYRLFGVTCHRGAELRFGHYTSYVKGPSGKWFHADDEDVRAVGLRDVLGDKMAYLLSYARVDDSEGPGSAAAQSPLNENGSSHANGSISSGDLKPSTNGATPPIKRKRDSDDDGDERRSPAPKRAELGLKHDSSPDIHTASRLNLFPSKLDPASPTATSLTEGSSKGESIQSATKPRYEAIPESTFYGSSKNKAQRHTNGPGSGDDSEGEGAPVQGWDNSPKKSKSARKREKKKLRREEKRSEQRGPPMPFQHGQMGSKGLKGMNHRIKSMQVKK